jgi:hypothetical protein
MTTHLFLAPAGGGKTAYLVDQVRRLAQGLTSTPRVVVPPRLQARAWPTARPQARFSPVIR